ncbi:hypothetical protein [Allorhodopirellula heiligendammensis]|uniref:Uncharacterized protein n=1 Tax=Allorhodopirellula heiligendammensis TaxID=2714739 RepID=A0A5C6C9C4_9BACT|nr:hypothetical protein [Allorhodopirellula heiligendammensis]TWU19369.1 hypothetical protein Poly21_15410 [Allorhodopirellula heiligendammensis]
MAEQHRIWIEQFGTAVGISDEFGTPNALEYLASEKFLTLLEAAKTDSDCRAESLAFVGKIKSIFE